MVISEQVTSDSPVGQVDLETSVQLTHEPCNKKTKRHTLSCQFGNDHLLQTKGRWPIYCACKRTNNSFKDEQLS